MLKFESCHLRMIKYGLASWLIPFIVSIFFYSPNGELMVEPAIFKAMMFIIASIVGASLLVKYFLKVGKNYQDEGIAVGISWVLINIIMDMIVLIPIMKVDFAQYFLQIGYIYLMVPTMALTIGYCLEHVKKEAMPQPVVAKAKKKQ